MAEGPYLLGIDFGTGCARVGIFDTKGTPVRKPERYKDGTTDTAVQMVHPRASAACSTGWREAVVFGLNGTEFSGWMVDQEYW